MPNSRFIRAAALAWSVAAPAVHAEAPPEPEMRTVPCALSSIWKDEARVKQIFGAENVTTGAVEGWDGSLATIIHADDPRQKLVLIWANEATRSKLKAAIAAADPADPWVTPVMWQSEATLDGVKIGDTLEQVEKLNAKPFYINGSGEGGRSISWNSGNLESRCKLSILLLPENPDTAFPTGQELLSDSPEVTAVRPRVTQFIVRF